MSKTSIYDFYVYDNKGMLHCMDEYKGKVLLIFNSAIHSSLSILYKDIEFLYQKYHSSGLEVLDFPCNQFHGEACDSDEEIERLCEEQYHTTFPRFRKIDVNGINADPLFLYLQNKKKFVGFNKGNNIGSLISTIHIKQGPNCEMSNEIKWNFTFFLIDQKGKVKKRFECTTNMKDVDKSIDYLLDHYSVDDETNV